jgi:hypothetical protein
MLQISDEEIARKRHPDGWVPLRKRLTGVLITALPKVMVVTH